VEDHQGKEVANEVLPQSWLAAESMKNSKVLGVAVVFIDKVGAEGSIGLPSLKNFLGPLPVLVQRLRCC